jgi:hypothetical protein
MTLVISVQTRGSLWLVADRRLSQRGRSPIDDAVKIACVEATDGVALVSYAGLGATALRNQPSEWIIRALLGEERGRLTLEQSLGVLAKAMQREFLPHLRQMRDRRHAFVAPAFLGSEPRLYTITLVETPTGVVSRYTRIVMGGALEPKQITEPFVLAGSGSGALVQARPRGKILLRLVKAYNQGKVSEDAVSNYLADLCYYAHQHIRDGSVGPNCIVAWRNSKTGRHKSGGGLASYAGVKEGGRVSLPTVASGINVSAIDKLMTELLAPRIAEQFEAMKRGEQPPEIWTEEMKERLSKLRHVQDEKLR